MPSLKELFVALQSELLSKLNVARMIDHAGEKGTASEEDWKRMLLEMLPARYHVSSGFVVDHSGSISKQIDLLILDRHYCPLFFYHSGKNYFPAESVYAVFDVKQELSKETIKDTAEKISSVRSLQRTSAEIPHAGGRFGPKKPFRIIGGIISHHSSWSPAFGESFVKSLTQLRVEEQIDIGCSLQDGAFTIDYSSDKCSPAYYEAELALAGIFLELLRKLQSVGTVPALDLEQYLSSIKSC